MKDKKDGTLIGLIYRKIFMFEANVQKGLTYCSRKKSLFTCGQGIKFSFAENVCTVKINNVLYTTNKKYVKYNGM